MNHAELLKLISDITHSADLMDIYIEDGALRSAETCLTDLEKNAAYLRQKLDKAIEVDNEVRRAWSIQVDSGDDAAAR